MKTKIGYLFLIIILLVVIPNVSAEISVDNVTTLGGWATNLSFSHTVISSSNRLLIVGVAYRTFTSARNVSYIEYNGVNLTYLGSGENGPGVNIWYLINPPIGTSNVTVYFNGDSDRVSIGAISLSGVNQTSPLSGLNITSGRSAYPQAFVSSESGDLVMDVMASVSSGLPTVGAGQTERWVMEYGGQGQSGQYAAGSTEPGASLVNMSWNLSESTKDWITAGFNINAYAANNAPNIIINSPENNSNFSVNYVLLNATVSDPEGNNMTVWFFGNSNLINTTENVLNNSIITFNWTSLIDGLYFWNLIVGDGDSNTSSDTRFFTIDTTSPTDNDPNDAYYVKNSAATIGWILTDSYAPGYYYVQRNGTTQNLSTAWTNNTNLNVWVNTTTLGLWNYTLIYNDSGGNTASDEVIITVIDNPPYWSNNATNIPASYSSIQSYFNITWQDDDSISTVLLESNYSGTATNYSMNNQGSGIYNYSIILPAGIYYWKSYANDSINQWNVSDTWAFTINKATTYVNLSLNGNENNITITYPEYLNVIYSTNALTSIMYRNSSNVSSENNTPINLATGYYNYTVINLGNDNYTGSSKTFFVTVNQNSSSCDILFNATSPLTYPAQFKVYTNCNSDFTLKRNGEIISNNSIQSLGAGTYNFSVTRIDNENYTNVYDEEFFNISKAVLSLNLSISQNWNVTYSTETTVTGSNCPIQLTCNLYRDDVLKSNPEIATLGYGVYNYIYNTTGNENYTSYSNSSILTVNQNTGSCDLLFNETSPQTYPKVFKVYTNCNSPFTLYRNGTIISNNSEQNLGIGYWNFSVVRTDQINYTNIRDTEFFTIQQNTRACDVLFNETSPLNYPSSFRVYTNCDSTFTLFKNGTSISNNSIQSLGAGLYSFIVVRTDQINYTNYFDQEFFTISKVTSACSLTFNPSNPITYGTQTNVSCSCNNLESSAQLWRNNININTENNQLITLGAGNYNYACNVSSTENYTSASNNSLFTVNKNSSIISLNINGSRSNKNYYNGTMVNLTCDMIFPLESQNVRLWTNYSDGSPNLWNSGISPIENISSLDSFGVFWFSCNWSGNENFTADNETWIITLSEILPPEVELNSPEDYYNSSNQTINFNCTASDDVNLVNVTLYGNWSGGWHANETNIIPINNSYNIFTKTIEDGTFIWNCYACDNQSKCSFAYPNRVFSIDSEAPRIFLTEYTNATKKRNSDYLTLNISVSDSRSGISSCVINVDTATTGNQTISYSDGWCNGTYPLTGASNGNKTIKVYANDTLGNWALNNSYVVWLDSSEPLASFGTNPADGSTQNSNTITFDFKCSDNTAADTIQLWTNTTGTWQADYTNMSYINNTWLNVTVTNILNGNYKWAVYCKDIHENLNWTNTNRTFSVDSSEPLASFGTSPIDNYVTNESSITFDLKCSDNVAVDTIQLWGNWSGTWEANYTNSSYENDTWLNITVVGIPQGANHKWAVYCNDSSNMKDWTDANRTIRIDYEIPILNLTNPEESYEFSSGTTSIQFSWNVTDNLDDSISCQIYTKGSYQTATSCTNATTCSQSIDGFSNGQSYSWYVICNDGANYNNSETRNFSIASDSSGGGGGGGAPPQNTTNEINTTDQIENNSSNLTEKYNEEGKSNGERSGEKFSSEKKITLGENEVAMFNINNENHSMEVISIEDNLAAVEFNSSTILVIFKVGETKEIDLDTDGANDLSVFLEKIENQKASFNVILIENTKKIINLLVEQEKSNHLAIISMLTCIFALIFSLFILRRKFFSRIGQKIKVIKS